jgi:hypothetical protein
MGFHKNVRRPKEVVVIAVVGLEYGPIMEIALRFILRASRILLNSINMLVNIKFHTHALGEELMALQGSVFWVYSFPFILLF